MTTDPAPEPSDFKYWAFISYSHRDARWGDWLHKVIETFKVPPRLVGHHTRDGQVPKRLFPVFRDRDELPTSGDLSANISSAPSPSRPTRGRARTARTTRASRCWPGSWASDSMSCASGTWNGAVASIS